MFYGLINLAWFDLITVGFTFIALILVQVINALWHISHEDGEKNNQNPNDTVDNVSRSVRRDSDDEKVRKSLKINDFKSVSFECETLKSNNLQKLTDNAAISTPKVVGVGVGEPVALTNAKLQKQQSEQCENGSSTSFATHVSSATLPSLYKSSSSSSSTFASSGLPSSSLSSSSSASTYPLTFRHSIGGLLNGSNTGNTSVPHFATSFFPDHFSDEYHEDEDTISLENLLPCDHTEIFSSRKISFIIDELLQTEGNYINNLKRGIQNYGTLQKYDKLPEILRGEDKQRQLLGNIEEILDLHEKQILPLMVGNQRDLKALFDEMSSHIEKHHFDCYVTFTMNKKTSMQLRKDNREWFQNFQTEINDRLGIDSFLVQPIQRLTRYPLLLQQFISEFYKSGINCKPVLASVCKLETRLRRLLEVVNQSEEVLSIDELPTELSIQNFGPFRRSTEFEAHNLRQRKKYKAKVFLFDQYLICVEVRKRRLAYRSHYTWDAIELKLNTPKSVSVLLKAAASGAGSSTGSFKSSGGKSSRENSIREEYEFTSAESSAVAQWLRSARKIIENVRIVESQKGKITLPMDLVLGAVFAIWFIWNYL